MRFLLASLLLLSITGCTSSRPPIPPGEIPTQTQVSLEDEQFGQQVFRDLSGRFQIDRDDARINRVRRLVDQLTTVRGNNQNIWHVYVFKHDSFHNAGATRGNYIFVWSALIDAVPDDGELSTILAHEIGHVLAGHTQPDPIEEVNEMLASLAGQTARNVMIQTGGNTVVGLAGLGGLLASELIKALIVNPGSQDEELEADQLGVFIMAEAGFDPQKAITFWERAQNDPNFQSATIEFLSTHPSSDTRLEALKKILPEAIARYNGGNPIIPAPQSSPPSPTAIPLPPAPTPTLAPASGQGTFSASPTSPTGSGIPIGIVSSPVSGYGTYWIAAEDQIPVYNQTSQNGDIIGYIRRGARVRVNHRLRRWLAIEDPYEGFVESPQFFPES